MAFIPILPLSCAPTPHLTPRMSLSQRPAVTRRAALRLAALSLTTIATTTLAQKIDDLQELKEEVEKLKYEDEVVEVGPDSAEKNVTRFKKKEEAPAYRAEEAALEKEDDKAYDAMLAKEKVEAQKLKEQFGKGK